MSDHLEEFFEEVGTAQRFSKPELVDKIEKEKESWSTPTTGIGLPTGVSISFDKNFSRHWLVQDRLYFEGRAVTATLPSGLYECIKTESGLALMSMPINTDGLITPDEPIMQEIIDEFLLFWKSKDAFVRRGLLHKRGFLLWGEAGGGKTCLIQLLSQTLMEHHNGIILRINNPDLGLAGTKMVRRIEPSRPIISIIEDIDAAIQSHGESSFLSLLDGEDQIENVVHVATTNYPSRLDARIVNRPSRFDRIIKIGMPSAGTRKLYLAAKEPSLGGKELDVWVEKTEGLSLAHLREIIIAVKCLNNSFEETIKRLRSMKVKPKDPNEFTRAGFME